MSHTSKPRESVLTSGRIEVRVGDATATVERASDGDGRYLDHYRIVCHELDDLDDPELMDPWSVDLPDELDLAAALRIADEVANRADEHLGRTRRFRADALDKIAHAIRTETRTDEAVEAEETDR